MSGRSVDTPVLFLIFNRPRLARRVFERIREAKPRRLFIAADGPRDGYPDDIANCEDCRRLVNEIDWDCEVKTLLRPHNLGCRDAVASAIDWFFEHVEEGIILEDDCLPDPSFFAFCAELLERYRHDDKIATIAGTGFKGEKLFRNLSYSFSAYQMIWGWATWRRAWRHYSTDLNSISEPNERAWLRKHFGSNHVADYWQRQINKIKRNELNTWDYQWNYINWQRQALGVIPSVNLIDNIGFGADATHTRGNNSPYAAANSIDFPLRHPAHVRRNRSIDHAFNKIFIPRVNVSRQLSLRTKRSLEAGYALGKRCCQVATWALRSKLAYLRTNGHTLPGRKYYRAGRRLGWCLLPSGTGIGPMLLACPVNNLHFFEFDFTERALFKNGFAPSDCLDIGSPYLFSIVAAQTLPAATISVMNPDQRECRFVDQIKTHLQLNSIDTIHAGVESLDSTTHTYDAIWSLSVIEHIAGTAGDDRDALKRMWRALRPGGRLILTVPTDKQAWDEYRDEDPYGTQPKDKEGRGYFFQRFYDETTIKERIIDTIGRPPAIVEWFGEKIPGHFHAYIDRWRKIGTRATVSDPLDIARNYRSYSSFSEMPGAGVCGLLFVKE